MGKISQEELLRVDQFLVCEKSLTPEHPNWGTLENGRWFASWPVLDNLGAVRGSLNFRVDPRYADYPGVSLLFEGRSISRVDLTPSHWVKVNPPWALGCPHNVQGNHVHTWADNRERIAAIGQWRLQARQPVPNKVKRVPQMLRWFADHINLRLYDAQFDFDFSPRRDLLNEEERG
jgi:hypothetical protein